MQVPQELVDAIIDKVALLQDNSRGRLSSPERELRACSLVSHPFLPRSQLHLFAAINCRRRSSDLANFDRLLAESPRFGELYVRYLALRLQFQSQTSDHMKTLVVPRILRLLPGLTHLLLDFGRAYTFADRFWGSQPGLLQTSLHATLSLPYLQSLCLSKLIFANVSELEILLSHAAGLKELILDHIIFHDSEPVRRSGVLDEPRVVIESLTLDSFARTVDAMVSSFSTVDIKHLRSLQLVSTPLFPLLKVNAQTLQKVRIAYSQGTVFDTSILEGNQTLRSIELKDVTPNLITSSLQLFGPLSHLKALKTISLCLATGLDVEDAQWSRDWPTLNASLAQAGDSLEDVFLSTYEYFNTHAPPDLARMKQRLPSVAGKISLTTESAALVVEHAALGLLLLADGPRDMQVPQELVDAIIDKVALLQGNSRGRLSSPERELRACSLVAHPFLPRSQLHLFTAITCHRNSSDFAKFDRLLAESPHIGELYVRYLALQFQLKSQTSDHMKTLVVPRILRLLPDLTHLLLDFGRAYNPVDLDWFWRSQPSLLQTSLRTALSLRSLRSLCLTKLNFDNVSELETLLSHAIGLKELILDHIIFRDSEPVRRSGVLDEPRVVIESLTLDYLERAVDAIVSSFSTVDIKHIRSMVLISTPMLPLLMANAQTLQKVRIVYSPGEPFGPDISAANQTLRSIEVKENNYNIASSLQVFGYLGHLKALKTISLHFAAPHWDADDGGNVVDWPKLNASLAQAGDALEDVFFSAYSNTRALPDLVRVKQRLPSVATKISIVPTNVFSRNYTFGPQL
ncbi:hypothetical protein C8J57DRAFT_1490151 [Mycena rebaudengoi]|nr:hypothetical protein C8J57DRAFT_1490151 [Mycena rebaudengoi]